MRVMNRKDHRHRRARGQPDHVNARRVDPMLRRDLGDGRHDERGFSRAGLCQLLVPVPAAVSVSACGLLRIKHGETLLVGEDIHPRPLRKFLCRLLATMQHYHQRNR